ncbi:LysR family transcriptional regulator [Vibrio sp. TRT 1302]|uniref:LysR family transcriptional regulator n=1 Tax=Vibrio sp. TRT 1302 TaxID=3418504 RepID=UPI003CEBC1FF
MKKIENLHLLYTLLAVYQTQSLSLAGQRLGKTTSSVSKDIAKLREQLEDPLFVRSDNKMIPTEYVKSVAPQIDIMLRDIRYTLASKNTISSEQYRKPIRAAVTHILMELYGDEISLQLHKQFPNTSIELFTWDSKTNQQIQNEELDFGIHLNLVSHPGKVKYKRIIESELVVICPIEDTGKTLAQLTLKNDFMFLRLKDWNDVETNLNNIANKHGFTFNFFPCITDNLNSAMKLVHREKLCFFVPKFIADYYKAPYITWPLPTTGLTIGLYHHAQQNEMLTKIFLRTMSNVIKSSPIQTEFFDNIE